MNQIYLLIGSNDGDRHAWIQKAGACINQTVGRIITYSGLYETQAWGLEDQPDFLNQALALDSVLGPMELLGEIRKIENQLGRQREIKWGQRTLDIDILFYNQEIIDLPELKIPHPEIQHRRFVLKPMVDIAPDYIHPQMGISLLDLLTVCSDPLEVKIWPSGI